MMMVSVLFVFVFSGCAGSATTSTISGTNHGGIAVNGASKKMILYIDGVEAGFANAFDGKKRYLDVETGTHVVSVKNAAGVLVFKKTIYIDDVLVTITIPQN